MIPIKNNRERGMDIVKSLAIVFVVVVHGLNSSGILNNSISSKETIIALIVRIFAMSNIPLFFISMGYLNGKYSFSENYIKRLKPVLISYLLAVGVTIVTEYYFNGTEMNFQVVFAEFFDMNVSNYAWFARMYFMFFLLIPFLNNWFESFKTEKEARIFLLILIGIVSLPPFTNAIFNEFSIYASLPAYFVQLYPLLYYFIGLYIKRFPQKLNKLYLTFGLTIVLLSQLFIFILRFTTTTINLDMFGSYGSLVNVVISSCVFLLLYKVDTTNKIFRKIVTYLSNNTFDIYLISHIFDRRIYPLFNELVSDVDQRLYFLIIPIGITLICSLIYAQIKKIILKNMSFVLSFSKKQKKSINIS